MTPLTRISSIAVPLLRDNIDTDMIIRIERLVLVPRRDLGAHAFEMLRFRADGSPDPECALNAPKFAGAEILVAGRNFGCGSSREAAVWALAGARIRVVIAEGFGDIFRTNCVKNGILTIALPEKDHARVVSAFKDGAAPRLAVDLAAQTLTLPDGGSIGFAIGAPDKTQLMSGEDDLTRTLRHRDAIEDHLSRWQSAAPWARLDPADIAAFDQTDS